jgi:hypothetical protein
LAEDVFSGHGGIEQLERMDFGRDVFATCVACRCFLLICSRNLDVQIFRDVGLWMPGWLLFE